MNVKPNVLILFTDQQRHDTINAAGHPHMITPNLDHLVAEGCLYRNAHSTNPVCIPARHDLLTGLPGRAHGYFKNVRQPIKDYGLPTLPRIFAENGYRTAAIGKMHFIPVRMHHGFGEMHLMEEIPRRGQDDQYVCYLKEQGLGHIQNIHGIRPAIIHLPQNSQMDEAHHGSTWVASRTIEWLKTNGNKPFLVMASWIHPHPPWDLPKECHGLYRSRDIPEPAPLSRSYPFARERSDWYGDFDTDEEKRRIREAYYTAVTMVDKNIGRVLDHLRETGQLDNTLVVFTSDHGEMLQDKGFYSKVLPYDGAARVPLIVRYPPEFARGTIREEFADLFDILPTCLDICGLDYPGDSSVLPGESLRAEGRGRDREHQISSSGIAADRWIMSRNRRYKYIHWYNQGTEEFYDMRDDPREAENLIESGGFPRAVYEELRGKAVAFEKQWGPEGMIQDDDFIVLDGKMKPLDAHAKRTFWQNRQLQYFDERSGDVRAAEFIREIYYARQNDGCRGKTLREILNDTELEEDFLQNLREFGLSLDMKEQLFK